MKVYTLIAAAAVAGLLGGCASTMTPEQRAQADSANRVQDADRLVQSKIAESTASIANTLELIERIERGSPTRANGSSASAPASAPYAASQGIAGQSVAASAPAGQAGLPASGRGYAPRTAVSSSAAVGPTGYSNDMLDVRIRIDWSNGSAEELLRTLAKQMNVPFKVMGEKHKISPVSVNFENESMGSILAAVGRQIDRDADIVLNKSQQPPVLELRFK